ncbi:MAG TPA: DUF5683 domain-containing protein [Bacteroidales bacterium]|nr:DUF5683 domain-containing protein [Bacteroidales bacterium]HPS17372.1 DUF5683 domain-containing protein [Bacteroidales bacterium]
MKAPAFINCFLLLKKTLPDRKIKTFFIILLLFTFSFQTFSQTDTAKVKTDTIKIKKHSPRKALIMSACVPGLGQIYNRKYWKVPVIYAGAATVTYFIIFNSNKYNKFRKAYQYSTDNDPLTINPYPDYDNTYLLALKNYYRRNLELSYIFSFGIYALNIIDASVDAHLFNFDMSDDLSMNIHPVVIPSSGNLATGLTFSFNIHHSKKQNIHKYLF